MLTRADKQLWLGRSSPLLQHKHLSRFHLSSSFLSLTSSAPHLFWLRYGTLTSVLPVSLLFPLKCLMAVSILLLPLPSPSLPHGVCGP